MTKRKKQVTMTVTVSVPRWLSAAEARREVRALIKDQCFWGHEGGPVYNWEYIDDSNFKLVSVTPAARDMEDALALMLAAFEWQVPNANPAVNAAVEAARAALAKAKAR